MARKLFSSSAVIEFFSGGDTSLSEIFCGRSDDELGMEDELDIDREDDF